MKITKSLWALVLTVSCASTAFAQSCPDVAQAALDSQMQSILDLVSYVPSTEPNCPEGWMPDQACIEAEREKLKDARDDIVNEHLPDFMDVFEDMQDTIDQAYADVEAAGDDYIAQYNICQQLDADWNSFLTDFSVAMGPMNAELLESVLEYLDAVQYCCKLVPVNSLVSGETVPPQMMPIKQMIYNAHENLEARLIAASQVPMLFFPSECPPECRPADYQDKINACLFARAAKIHTALKSAIANSHATFEDDWTYRDSFWIIVDGYNDCTSDACMTSWQNQAELLEDVVQSLSDSMLADFNMKKAQFDQEAFDCMAAACDC